MTEYLLEVHQSKQRLNVAFTDRVITEGLKVTGPTPLLTS